MHNSISAKALCSSKVPPSMEKFQLSRIQKIIIQIVTYELIPLKHHKEWETIIKKEKVGDPSFLNQVLLRYFSFNPCLAFVLGHSLFLSQKPSKCTET